MFFETSNEREKKRKKERDFEDQTTKRREIVHLEVTVTFIN